jgi:hypothetical protein
MRRAVRGLGRHGSGAVGAVRRGGARRGVRGLACRVRRAVPRDAAGASGWFRDGRRAPSSTSGWRGAPSSTSGWCRVSSSTSGWRRAPSSTSDRDERAGRDVVRRGAGRAGDAAAVLLGVLRTLSCHAADAGGRGSYGARCRARRGRRRGAPRARTAAGHPAYADHVGARRVRARDHAGHGCAAGHPGAGSARERRGVMSTIWIGVSHDGTTSGSAGARVPTVPGMSSTHLTRRLVVDHCRMRSSLCRLP